MRELVWLAEKSGEFERLGVRVFALAVEDPAKLQTLQNEFGNRITLLADAEGEAARALGLIDPDPFPPGRILARAATLFFDRDGRFRWAAYPKSYRARPDTGDVLAAIRRFD